MIKAHEIKNVTDFNVAHSVKCDIKVLMTKIPLYGIANFSDMVSLIMPVNKQDGTICIQYDYKLMVNKIAKPDVCPVIKTDELFTAPRGTVKTLQVVLCTIGP